MELPLPTPWSSVGCRASKEGHQYGCQAIAAEGSSEALYGKSFEGPSLVASYGSGHWGAFCGNPESWHPRLPSPVGL